MTNKKGEEIPTCNKCDTVLVLYNRTKDFLITDFLAAKSRDKRTDNEDVLEIVCPKCEGYE